MKRFLRRRKFVVDSGLQYKLLLYSLGYVLFYVAAIGAGLFVPLMIRLASADPATPEAQAAATSFLYLHYNFWPVALLSVAVVVLHSLQTSHRIAGPLYRFRRIFTDLAEGAVPPAEQLRRNDLLQSEMQLINEMLAGLRSRISEIQREEELLRHSISECRHRAGLLADAEISQVIMELAERGDRLEHAVRAIDIRK